MILASLITVKWRSFAMVVSPSVTALLFRMRFGGERELGGVVVIHFAQEFGAALDHHVACSAGAVASAGVLDVEPCADAYVEEGEGLAMVVIGQGIQIEFEGLVGWEDGNFGHESQYSAI